MDSFLTLCRRVFFAGQSTISSPRRAWALYAIGVLAAAGFSAADGHATVGVVILVLGIILAAAVSSFLWPRRESLEFDAVSLTAVDRSNAATHPSAPFLIEVVQPVGTMRNVSPQREARRRKRRQRKRARRGF